jgi:hypothetical protein
MGPTETIKLEDYSMPLHDDVAGTIEKLPTKESRGLIRLEKHMGSGEGKHHYI